MQDLSNCRIMVVDDTEANLDIIVENLCWDYNVSVAMDGETALVEIAKNPPDLILLDIMMPGIDGFEVCKRLKADPEFAEIPVIFLTAMGHPEDKVKGLEYGSVDYITKPFHEKELQQRVKIHLELKLSKETIKWQSNNYKELIHVLCHDLINPIGAIYNIMNLSKQKPDILKNKKDLITIATENSLKIIELVRTYLTVDEKKVALRLSAVNFKHCLSESLNILQERIEKKGINIDIDADEDIEVYVERTSFINSVLNNILTNAIKFSFENSKIFISAHQDGNSVTIAIKDTGIGIPEDLLNNIFDVSKAVSREGTNGETGIGFGMSLLKKFITEYGGDIAIRSKESEDTSTDHGTQVTIVLKSGPDSNMNCQ